MQEIPSESAVLGRREQRSLAGMFAEALVLPFRRPARFLGHGLVPGALLVFGALVFPGVTLVGQPGFEPGVFLTTPSSGTLLMFPSATILWLMALPPPGFAIAIWLIWFVSLIVFTVWLLSWQRDTIEVFSSPLGRSIRDGLRGIVGYAIALGAWFLLPIVIYLPLVGLSWILTGSFYSEFNIGPEFAWLALFALPLLLIPGFWLYARLALYPALVARQGRRGAFGQAWRLTRGHAFGLALSFIAYLFLAFVIAYLLAHAAYSLGGADDRSGMTGAILTGLCNFVATMMLSLWCVSLAALCLRAWNPDSIDPATFD